MSAAITPDAAPELQLENIAKSFGATRALDGAQLTVRPGTVHALLGENGAGKTTLMRVAFGLVPPDYGQIRLDGRQVRFRTPREAINAGIGMVHQHFTNVPTMTVAENVALGGHGRFRRPDAEGHVRNLGAETGLTLDPTLRAEGLSVGAQQRLEILKAISRRARILILDEPTAVLAPNEAAELLRWLRDFARRGSSVILITHKLAEALAIADDVTVLRFGQTVFRARATATSADSLAEAMLGVAPPRAARPQPLQSGRDVLLRVSALTLQDHDGIARIVNASFTVHQGEIIGIAALDDSGHQLLLRAIAGRIQPSSGSIERVGRVGLIPEDRLRDALIPSFSLSENLALKGAGERRGRIDWSSMRVWARALAGEFDVRSESVDVPASTLSGGNQQKLVLARELTGAPKLIVAENPTRGLDMRATASVHERLCDAAANGAGVIVHSSDLDEVLSLATRVFAVHAGSVIEVPNDREVAGRAMIGLAPPSLHVGD